MQVLKLVRGIPGSGKSTYAKKFPQYAHFEADMYHIKDGVYDWKPENQKAAHAWCLASAEQALKEGNDVIVSNTFTKLWELEPYFEMGIRNGLGYYDILVETMRGNFGSIHNVPEATMDRMRHNFDENTEELYDAFFGNCGY